MDRKTLNFDSPATWVQGYTRQGTLEHRALVQVVGERAALSSESGVLIALVEHAHAEVEQERLRLLYDDAMSAQGMEPEAEAAMGLLEQDIGGSRS